MALRTSRRRSMRCSAAVSVAALALLAGCGGGAAERTPEAASWPGTWDLVALGDSTPGGYGIREKDRYTRVYARLLAQELGIRVRVHDHSTWALQTVADWKTLVATDRSLRADLRRAEVVTTFLGAHDLLVALAECTGNWPHPLRTCISSRMASMPADLDRLLASVRTLAGKKATVLVGWDGASPPTPPEGMSGKPYWPQVKAIQLALRPGMLKAADANEAIVIPLSAQRIRPALLQPDGVHFNEKGHRFLAELHLAHDGLGRR